MKYRRALPVAYRIKKLNALWATLDPSKGDWQRAERRLYVAVPLRHQLAAHDQIEHEAAQAGNGVGRVGDLLVVL